MSRSDDCPSEMPFPLDDAMAEKLVTGRVAAGADLAPLASFLDEMRAETHGPAPAPSAALASILASGLPAGQLASERAGAPAPGWAAASPPAQAPREPDRSSSRRVGWGWAVRLAGTTALVKIGLGVGVAAASVTGAAAVGVPVARDIVEAVTPVEFPDRRPAPAPLKPSDRPAPAPGAGPAPAAEVAPEGGPGGVFVRPEQLDGRVPPTVARPPADVGRVVPGDRRPGPTARPETPAPTSTTTPDPVPGPETGSTGADVDRFSPFGGGAHGVPGGP